MFWLESGGVGGDGLEKPFFGLEVQGQGAS